MGKAEERALALAARRALTAVERREKSETICRTLLRLPVLETADVILSYMAAWDEVDLSSLHEVLWARGKTLAFPVSGRSGHMAAWAPSEPGAVTEGRFGIREPDTARAKPVAPEEIGLALIPCLAFDGALTRLGHGAGYYDRYLPRCTGAVLVAAAFEAQRLTHVTAEAHDRAMDIAVTESGIYRREEAGFYR